MIDFSPFHRGVLRGLAFVPVAVALAASPALAGGQLRDSLPEPGKDAPKGQVAFVGFAGSEGVALVRHGSELVAFVCDGRRQWAWLSGRRHGKQLKLGGTHGAALALTSVKGKLRGTLRIAGHTRTITLRPAGPGAGLRRTVIGGIEAAWVVGNDGRVTGAGTQSSAVVFSTKIETTDPAADDGTTTGSGGTGGGSNGSVSPELFGRARCMSLVIKNAGILGRRINGTSRPGDGAAEQQIGQRFTDLNCLQYGLALA
jgi:hypothetical protein